MRGNDLVSAVLERFVEARSRTTLNFPCCGCGDSAYSSTVEKECDSLGGLPPSDEVISITSAVLAIACLGGGGTKNPGASYGATHHLYSGL